MQINGIEILQELNKKWQQKYQGLAKLEFSEWVPWKLRSTSMHINKAGVYMLAKYESNETPQSIDVLDEHIICVGRTTRSLKARLALFDGAAFGKGAPHAEGDTYKKVFGANQEGLYVSICPVYWTDKKVNHDVEEFVIKKVITWLEVCLRGTYVYKWGRLPKLNKE